MDPEESTIQKLLDDEELLSAMLSMPDRVNEKVVEKRREELFSMLWEHTSLKRHYVITEINKVEMTFVDEYEGMGVPEWILRLEAQDHYLKHLSEKLKEEGVVES